MERATVSSVESASGGLEAEKEVVKTRKEESDVDDEKEESSDEAETDEDEEELKAPFPVGMWDLLHCDPKVRLL